jgi:hypothetical protein
MLYCCDEISDQKHAQYAKKKKKKKEVEHDDQAGMPDRGAQQ